MKKSEFDTYINMTYVELREGAFCLDNGRYLRQQKFRDTVDNLSDVEYKNEQVASSAILVGDLDILEKSNNIDSSIDSICAKLELELASPKYREN